MYSPIALADEIIVVDADNIWNLTLENATDIGRLIGEPGVMVVKYADGITYKALDNATDIGRLIGEPGVIVTKYADFITPYKITPPPIISDPVMCGDLDENKIVNAADLQILLDHVFKGTQINEIAGDVDSSGYINIIDVRLLMNNIADPENYNLNCTDNRM